MKKILFMVFLMVLGTSAFAQKNYLSVIVDLEGHYNMNYGTFAYLSGDIPSDMSYFVRYRDVNAPLHGNDEYYAKTSIGLLFNILSEKGYNLEQSLAQAEYTTFIFTRVSSNPSRIQSIQADPDEEVTEVARYNLQGMAIGKNEKGVQIVVYSNYTTKTIIVE